MKKALRDPWAQLFAFLTIVWGALAASRALLPPAPPAAAASPPAAAAPPSVTVTAGGAASPSATAAAPPAGVGPSLSGPNVTRLLTPKTPGKWIVDGSGALDADTAIVEEALTNAAHGDRIELRPGLYKVELTLDKKRVTLAGTGSAPDKTVLEASQRTALKVEGGTALLENLLVRSAKAGSYGAAIEVSGGHLELSRARVEAFGSMDGISLKTAVLNGSDCELSGGHNGVDLSESATAKLSRCVIKVDNHGISADRKTDIELSSVRIEGGEMAVWGNRKTRLKITDSKISGQESWALSVMGAGSQAELSKVTITKSKTGLALHDGAGGTVSDSDFLDIADSGIYVAGGGVVQVRKSAFMSNRSALVAFSQAKIEASGCTIGRSSHYAVHSMHSAQILLEDCTLEGNLGVGVQIEKLASATLRRTKIRGNGDTGVFVGESCSATLDRATIEGGLQTGVALARDARLDGSGGAILGHRRCGLAFLGETAAVKLRDAKINQNECAAAFLEGGTLDSERGDFLGNRKGAFLFQESNRSKIALTGGGNKTK